MFIYTFKMSPLLHCHAVEPQNAVILRYGRPIAI